MDYLLTGANRIWGWASEWVYWIDVPLSTKIISNKITYSMYVHMYVFSDLPDNLKNQIGQFWTDCYVLLLIYYFTALLPLLCRKQLYFLYNVTCQNLLPHFHFTLTGSYILTVSFDHPTNTHTCNRFLNSFYMLSCKEVLRAQIEGGRNEHLVHQIRVLYNLIAIVYHLLWSPLSNASTPSYSLFLSMCMCVYIHPYTHIVLISSIFHFFKTMMYLLCFVIDCTPLFLCL